MKDVFTPNAPAAIGPYTQAKIVGNMVYTSGQIAIVPATGNVIEGGIEAQTARVLENLKAIVEAAGSSLAKAVKTTVYITDINDFGKVNEIYAGYFTDNPPARVCVEVSNLPKGALIEIDLIAEVA